MSEDIPVLRIDRVWRDYEHGSVHALAGVSFDARAGEIIGIIGASGCGKSTLLSLAGLLELPSSGHISIAGQRTESISDRSMFRARNIGFVFQFHHMIPTMTLVENVAAPAIALGVPRPERNARARALLAQMGLSARADFLPTKVSGGERQRAAVARALINAPRLILADEPTGNLDSHNGQLVLDLLLTQARSNGATVLIATHNPDIAAATDRCIELRDGRLVSPPVMKMSDLTLVLA